MKNILFALAAFIVCSSSFAYFDHGDRIAELEKQVKELKHKFSDVNAERDVTCRAICGTKITSVNYVVSGFTVV